MSYVSTSPHSQSALSLSHPLWVCRSCVHGLLSPCPSLGSPVGYSRSAECPACSLGGKAWFRFLPVDSSFCRRPARHSPRDGCNLTLPWRLCSWDSALKQKGHWSSFRASYLPKTAGGEGRRRKCQWSDAGAEHLWGSASSIDLCPPTSSPNTQMSIRVHSCSPPSGFCHWCGIFGSQWAFSERNWQNKDRRLIEIKMLDYYFRIWFL